MPENDTEQPTIQPIRTKAADARQIYIDSTRMASSPWDIRMHFSLLKESEPGIVIDEEQVVVIMSPQHAKALLGVMVKNVKKWEDKYGELPAPEDQTEEEVEVSPESKE
jgi:predicted class III extradiol MEMO1 family dioxygenase